MSPENLPARQQPRTPTRPAQAPSAPATGGGISIDPMRIALTYWPIVAAAFIVSCVLGVGIYIALGKFAPKFTSIATFQVLPVASADNEGGTIGAGGAKELELHIGTQRQVMVSDQILRSAIDTNEVRNDTKWIRQYMKGGAIDVQKALKDLRNMVSTRVITDTTIMQLTVTTENAADAATIGKAIQDRFLRDNDEQNAGDVNARLREVLARITDTTAALGSVEQSIAARVNAENLEALNIAGTQAAQEIKNLQPELVRTRTVLAGTRETLDQRERLLGGAGVAYDPNSTPVGFVFPETTRAAAEQTPVVRTLDQQISGITAEIQAQQPVYGDEHQVIKRLRSRQRALEDQRTQELESSMQEIFATELESLRNSIPRLERTERELGEDLEEAKNRQNEIQLTLNEIDNLKIQQQRYRATLERLDDSRTELELIVDRAGRVRVLSSAAIPDHRSFPKPIPIVGATIVVLTGLVAGLIFLKELREQRIRSPRDVAAIPRTRVLGVLPDVSMDPGKPKQVERAILDAPDGAIAESVRQIRSTLIQRMDERGHKTLIIGSGMPGSGATTVAANISESIASTGRRVLVIDANLRRPAMHSVFELDDSAGLAEVLRGETSLSEAAVRIQGVDELEVLSAGIDRKRAYERFLSESMEELLEEARARYDVVIIDVAPGIVSSDMNALASYVDASMLVVRAYAEKRGLLARLRNQLAVSGAEFMGVVVNGVKPAAGGYMKRNFEQTLAYQSPKRVENTAPTPKAPKKQKKKLRGAPQKDAATTAGEPTDES